MTREENGLTYKQVGDVWLPETTMAQGKNLGKYGGMRLHYLREHREGLYTLLLLNGELEDRMLETDKQAWTRLNEIKDELKKQSPPPKTDSFMEQWHYNQWIQDTAEESVLSEIVYA